MIGLVLLGAALAQTVPDVPDLDVQLYRPPVDARHTLWAEDSGHVVDRLTGEARATAHYVHVPFLWRDASGERHDLLTHVAALHLSGAVSYQRARLALTAPVYLLASGPLAGSSAGLGDLGIDLRATLFDRSDAGVGLAFSGRMSLPTNTLDAPLGMGGVGGELVAIGDVQLGDMLFALNLGYRAQPKVELSNITLDDQLLLRFGMGYALSETAGLSLDIGGHANLSAPLSNRAAAPMEALLGGWGRTGDWVIRGGLGTGLTPGIGSSTLRAVVTVGFEPRHDVERTPRPRHEVRERIDLAGRVYFDTNKADIQARSFPVLDKVVRILADNTDIKKVSIEGHTDSRGTEEDNRVLSDQRAAAVLEYLVAHGVERSRLRSVGYGESRPIDPSENEAAWETNRRVEFVIVRRGGE